MTRRKIQILSGTAAIFLSIAATSYAVESEDDDNLRAKIEQLREEIRGNEVMREIYLNHSTSRTKEAERQQARKKMQELYEGNKKKEHEIKALEQRLEALQAKL